MLSIITKKKTFMIKKLICAVHLIYAGGVTQLCLFAGRQKLEGNMMQWGIDLT